MKRSDVLGMKPGPAQWLLVLLLTCMAPMASSFVARAEPITCGPGQPGCGEAVIEEKVKRSFDGAAHVFVGQLQSVQDSKSGGANTRIFTFEIRQQYKGALPGKIARISIDSYVAKGKPPSAGPGRSLDEFEKMEAAAESVDTEEAKREYEARVESLREEIKKNGVAAPALTHVVRVRRASGDISIRDTDIPMRVGERYAVFVFSNLSIAPEPKNDTGKVHNWVANPVDLYPIRGERGKRVLAALKLVSKQKHSVPAPPGS